MSIKASDLILNGDGSVYHLGLLPQDIADTIITVGDPTRVSRISNHFESITVKKEKREFCTHTGIYKGKRITVMSTGMGTDNIDIAITELDALVNIDLKESRIKENPGTLDIIRIGTTGSIKREIPVGSFIISGMAIGFDGLLHYYPGESYLKREIAEAFVKHSGWCPHKAMPYVVESDKSLFQKLSSASTITGFTGTAVGFYGPQGRTLRTGLSDPEMIDKLTSFDYNGHKITNLEMETSGMYGLAKLMGHRAISMNAVLANRATGEFAENPGLVVDELIKYTLGKIGS